MSYTTQMDAARQGIITPQMEAAAKKEQIEVRELQKLMAQGKAVIPANKLHTCLEPNAIGSMLKDKDQCYLGTSRDWKDLDMELEKVNDAVKMGADPLWTSAPLETPRNSGGSLRPSVPHHRYCADL